MLQLNVITVNLFPVLVNLTDDLLNTNMPGWKIYIRFVRIHFVPLSFFFLAQCIFLDQIKLECGKIRLNPYHFIETSTKSKK